MKKFIALLCAGVLTCSMGMTAFAAQSPGSAEAEKIEQVKEELKNNGNLTIVSEESGSVASEETTYEIKDSAGNTVTVGGTTITLDKADGSGTVEVSVDQIQVNPISQADAATQQEAAAKATEEAAKTIVEKGMVAEQTKVAVVAYEVSVPAEIKDNISASNTVTIVFNIPGYKKGDIVKVLHKPEGQDWEILDGTVVADGKVAVTFSSFSPVVFLNLSQTANNNNNNNNNNEEEDTTTTTPDAGTTTSPKTGDVVVPYLVMFAAVGAAFVTGKKAIRK